MTQPLKYDKEKVRLELIPPEFLEATGRGLTYGARKYTVTKWEKIWLALQPTALSLVSPNGVEHVVRVTKNNYALVIQSLLSDREKIVADGEQRIERSFSNLNETMRNFQEFVNESVMQPASAYSKVMGSPSSLWMHNYNEAVKYAEALNGCTLIMTMPQDSTEVYFVVSATKVSDCLEILLKELKLHLTTSERNELGTDTSGAGNWAIGDGFDWSRLYGGLLRHLNSWNNGEDFDPESGNHHLDHACCMLAFLVAHTRRRIGKDDRLSNGVTPRPVKAESLSA